MSRNLNERKLGSSVVLPCTCNNKFQDKMYGLGRRVHNIGKQAGSTSRKARCTVCEDVKV